MLEKKEDEDEAVNENSLIISFNTGWMKGYGYTVRIADIAMRAVKTTIGIQYNFNATACSVHLLYFGCDCCCGESGDAVCVGECGCCWSSTVMSMVVSCLFRVCTLSRGDCGWVRRRTKIITNRTMYVTLPWIPCCVLLTGSDTWIFHEKNFLENN